MNRARCRLDPSRVRFAAILRSVFVLALATVLSDSVAAQPSSTSICNLPGLPGTAAYNRYCTASGPVMAPAPPTFDPLRSFPAVIADSVDFHLTKKDGRTFTADELRGGRFEFGDILMTGPTGRVQVLLPDQTIFTLGPNSEMAIDDFVYDPANGTNVLSAAVVKGLFRFVTGKVQEHRDLNVKVAVGTIGVRGTDIEFNQGPDGSGYVKLFSGRGELTPYDTDTTIELQAGQMITWTDFTKLSDPQPIQ
jgi:FecR-like protein